MRYAHSGISVMILFIIIETCAIFLGKVIVVDLPLLFKNSEKENYFSEHPRQQPDIRNLPEEARNNVEYIRSNKISDYFLQFPVQANTLNSVRRLEIFQRTGEGALPSKLVSNSKCELPEVRTQYPQAAIKSVGANAFIKPQITFHLSVLLLSIAGFGFIFQILIRLSERRSLNLKRTVSEVRFDFSLLWGILILICIELVSINISLIAIYIAAIVFVVVMLFKLSSYKSSYRLWVKLLIILFGFVLFALTLLTPLIEWDARSIWFHHGKIMFFFSGEERWTYLRDTYWSHPDYPKGLAVLAAYIAKYFGYWTDAIEKGAIFILLCPLLVSLVELPAIAFSTILFFSLSRLAIMTNGYMDGIMAVYIVALVVTISEIIFQERRDASPNLLMLAILLLALIPNFKNEGLIFCGVTVFIGGIYISDLSRKKHLFIAFKKHLFIFILSIIPIILWVGIKLIYNIHNDLTEGGILNLFYNAYSRLKSPECIFKIADWLIIKNGCLGIYALVYAVLYIGRSPSLAKRKSQFSFILATAFLIALFFIYLSTPNDLLWHLETSAYRTVLTPLALIVLSIFFLVFEDVKSISKRKSYII